MKRKASVILSATLMATLMMSSVYTPISMATGTTAVQNGQDTDADGLLDRFEMEVSNPQVQDTDGDGVLDGQEDADLDGVTNLEEQTLGTNPVQADTDGDGLKDADEVAKHKTDPLQADSDGDHLDDGSEVALQLDPHNPDADGDGVLDGDVNRSYTFPSNSFGIQGTMSGKSDVLKRVSIRKTPILLLQELRTAQTFDIISYDPSLMFSLTIPYEVKSEKDDLILLRYDKEKAQLLEVGKQKHDKKAKTIQADFQGGGSFVVLSKQEWKETLRPDQGKKEKFKKFKGKAKLNGLPSFELDGDAVNEEGVFKIEKKKQMVETATSLDPGPDMASKELTETAYYKVNDIYTASDGAMNVTVTAISPESGKNPTILVHGLWGGPTTWGFTTRWTNNLSRPKTTQYVYSNETFTGSSYSNDSLSYFNNIDVHYVTGTSDSTEMGPNLINNYGYTFGDDLFIFSYCAPPDDNTVVNAAYELNGFMSNMKVKKSWIAQFNLVGHSMGGLVSRYVVENISSNNVSRVVTLGTPHFGSHLMPGGELDREDSQLWGTTSTKLKNNAFIPYIGFSGWNPSSGILNSTVRGFYSTSLGLPHYGQNGAYITSWDQYIRNSYQSRVGTALTANLNDDAVRVDSALGADKNPDYNMPAVKMNKRFMIWDETYGQHSTMRKYGALVQNTVNALQGAYDYETKD